MIVTLDGKRIDTPFAPESTLQAIVDQVRAMQPDDRLVVSVAINGHPLADAELNAALGQVVAADAQVDLESSDRTELVVSALRGLALRFQEAVEPLVAVADQLSAGQVTQGLQRVGEFIGLWQTCYRTLAQCSGLLGRDLTEYEHQGQSLTGHLGQMVDKLTELRAGLEARDMVLVADLVRYELRPLSQKWHELLSGLADELAGQSGPA